MSLSQRIAIAVGVVSLDLVIFFVPLSAIAIAYIVVARPPWFLDAVARLYRDPGRHQPPG